MTIEIALPDEIASKLERAAQDRGVSVSELVFYCVIEKLERDSEFRSAADDVLRKNALLHERLLRNE
ncbi:MAG: ribbon-helix-helix protein, CopG family [Thermoanaerobaculia bacterium]